MIKRLYLFNNLAANQSVSLPNLNKDLQQPLFEGLTSPKANLNVLTSYLLQSPQLAIDFTPSFTPNSTKISKLKLTATLADSVTLNYVNAGIYTSSFAALATTFESTLTHNDRSNVYNSPLSFTANGNIGFNTVLTELNLKPTRNETELNRVNAALTRDITLLADLRLVYMLF